MSLIPTYLSAVLIILGHLRPPVSKLSRNSIQKKLCERSVVAHCSASHTGRRAARHRSAAILYPAQAQSEAQAALAATLDGEAHEVVDLPDSKSKRGKRDRAA